MLRVPSRRSRTVTLGFGSGGRVQPASDHPRPSTKQKEKHVGCSGDRIRTAAHPSQGYAMLPGCYRSAVAPCRVLQTG